MLVVIALGFTLVNLDLTSKRISRDSILIGQVQRGQLDITVSANGVLLPREVEALASQVEGRVIKLNVKPGNKVTKGQVLAVLDNPTLVAAAEEAFSAWEGAKAQKTSFQVDLENRLLLQKSATLQARFAFEKARLQNKAEEELLEDGIVSMIDYQKTKLDVEQLGEIHKLEQERLKKFEANMQIELSTQEAMVTQKLKSLERAQNAVEALTITSGIDGIVQKWELEIGQRLQPGSDIGRVAQQESLYAELKVQARQAGNIQKGQRTTIDTRNGLVDGIVSRVEPAVNEGTVTVDVELVGELPTGSRPELQVEGVIYQDQFENTLFVDRPSMVKTDSLVSVYRLDEDGVYAERVKARLGKASINRVQILDGLKEQDKIILSDSSGWQDHDVIRLN